MVRRASLAVRLLTGYGVIVILILAALALLLDRTLQATFLRDLTTSLRSQAVAVREALPADDPDLQPVVIALGRELHLRITVIATDGEVLADSAEDPATLENHAHREEVRGALRGDVGVSSRRSTSTGRPYRYVALPPEGDRIVRLALPLSIVERQLADVRRPIIAGAALAALLGVLAVWLLARRLAGPLHRLTDAVAGVGGAHAAGPVIVDGPAELAVLADTLNRMTAELDRRIDEIRAGEREREAILTALSEGVVVVDAADQIRYANPAAHTLLGIPPGTRSVSSPSLRSVVDAARGGRPAEVEVELGVPSRAIRTSAVPLGDDVLVVLRDVTAAKRVEVMRREFVADASHELKTPAAAIRAAAETVESTVHDDPAAAGRFAAQLRRDATRLSDIVSDLLDLSRLEAERPTFGPVRLDLVVADELDRLRDRAAEAGLSVEWNGRPVTVTGSPEDLGLLVRNLLDNAVRYTTPGGRIVVGVGEAAGRPLLTVADTGVGIPSRDIPRVFERFYRVDRARARETGGTGLGLSIARHVAEQHGGTIEAESELGRGSTFRVTFPADAPATEPARPSP